MLQPFGPELWTVEGPVVDGMAGFRYPTRMAVIRLTDGGLFIWSPTALSPELRRETEALGPVRHIVAPNALHHMSLPDWHTAFPQALIHGAPGVNAKQPAIRFASDLGGDPHLAWAGDIRQVLVPNKIADEVVFFHRTSGTVIFTDLLQNFSRGWFTGWRGWVARLDRMIGSEPQVPRKFRLALRSATSKETLRQVLDWPAERVLMAHGTPVSSNAAEFLKKALHPVIVSN
ncbi:hypothetical protein OB2597_12101 [Pseudooceanicola batsensis HTCC2597]|uniref:DUF4336 domain-containing protein n=1 Tax=Pseudooceanicola batsensis (strain ATCC BAA-863 / DSM 15984 / KCTC 12145 / HTCC2597) TaxID=252305 RepID=A3TWJ0_PSEBH|nr:DUF4336 domain-containing protein [Pseudooceanicola batsensis]EAQ03986.1 hypothetical protein OB2597_12101 [Pseudooceanicola batsensis HTCC2597]